MTRYPCLSHLIYPIGSDATAILLIGLSPDDCSTTQEGKTISLPIT